MNRRRFVLGAAGAIACPLCVALAGRPVLAAGGKAHWSYDGDTGPGVWGKLDESYSVCSTGAQQSPIDLAGAIKAEIGPASIGWTSVELGSIVNNGHTIQVNTPGAGHIELDGSRYNLLQFHFHHKSEHTVDGKQYPMEAHFVHKAANGDSLAVIGVFLVEGAESAVLAPIWSGMPKTKGEASNTSSIDPKGLLPKSQAAFRYAGSLTTPPCSEVVAWTVMKEPVSASADQIAEFAKLFPNNYRPLQPLSRRFILLSD